MCTGKPKILCDFLYCDIHFIVEVWTESTISLRYLNRIKMHLEIAIFPSLDH